MIIPNDANDSPKPTAHRKLNNVKTAPLRRQRRHARRCSILLANDSPPKNLDGFIKETHRDQKSDFALHYEASLSNNQCQAAMIAALLKNESCSSTTIIIQLSCCSPGSIRTTSSFVEQWATELIQQGVVVQLQSAAEDDEFLFAMFLRRHSL